jgi:hypothetical protein
MTHLNNHAAPATAPHDWLDQLLYSQGRTAIADLGFSERLMQRLPKAKTESAGEVRQRLATESRRERRLAFATRTGTALGGIVALLTVVWPEMTAVGESIDALLAGHHASSHALLPWLGLASIGITLAYAELTQPG